MRQKICLLPGSPGMYIAFSICHSDDVTILTWEEAVIGDITILTISLILLLSDFFWYEKTKTIKENSRNCNVPDNCLLPGQNRPVVTVTSFIS